MSTHPQTSTRGPGTIPLAIFPALGLIAVGVLFIVEMPWASIPAVAAIAGAGWGAWKINIVREKRWACLMNVATQIHRLQGLSHPDLSTLRASKWIEGVPGRLRIFYTFAAPDHAPEWKMQMAELVGASLGEKMRIRKHKTRRHFLDLELVLAQPDDVDSRTVEDLRLEEVSRQLLGADATVRIEHAPSGEVTRFEVSHHVATKAAQSGFRGRAERTVTALLEGRWRANWNLQKDTVIFEQRPEFPAVVPHPACLLTQEAMNKIPFGVDEEGRVVYWDLKGPGPHALVVGKTGTGKTVTINGMVYEFSRRAWATWIVDPKRIEFLGAKKIPNVRYVATEVETMVAVIHHMHEKMEARYQQIENGGDESDFTPELLVLDEYRNFHRMVTAWWSMVKVKGNPAKCPIFDEVAAIAEKGRSARIHLLMGTQRPDADYLAGGMRDNFDTRISMGRLSPQGAIMMWDSPHYGVAVPRSKRGRGTAITSEERISEVQTYWTPDPRRAYRDQIPADLEILRSLTTAEAIHGPARIQWPPITEGREDDDVLRWEDVIGATFVDDSSPQDGQKPEEYVSIERPSVSITLPPPSERDPDEDMASLEDDFQPPSATGAARLNVGDMILVDEAFDLWAIIDELDVDEEDGCVNIQWRSDEDEEGALTVDLTQIVSVRRPNGEDAEE